jgi:hypothetical protein
MPVAKDIRRTAPAVHRDRSAASHRDRSTGSSDAATTAEYSPTSPVSSWETESEAHLLRLCLDLQLDAMLLTMGAAAAQSRHAGTGRPAGSDRFEPAPSGTVTPTSTVDHPEAPPWRRWVTEDVEMVSALAADVMVGGASLPTALGTDLDRAVPAAAVDNLIARYESMAALLADILPPEATGPPAPHRAHAQEALARCQGRLRELRSTRLAHTPARGIPVSPMSDTPPVPGEWLG